MAPYSSSLCGTENIPNCVHFLATVVIYISLHLWLYTPIGAERRLIN